jgi:alcohol dehydrogenase (NADP+)
MPISYSLQITVYEALQVAGTKPSDRVGVVGLGGLGHLAVMYARAMGCEVIVFSGSETKRFDAMALGATEYCVLSRETPSSPQPAVKLNGGVNVLLLCGGGLPNFDLYVIVSCYYLDSDRSRLFPLLARRAAIIPLIIQGDPLVIPQVPATSVSSICANLKLIDTCRFYCRAIVSCKLLLSELLACMTPKLISCSASTEASRENHLNALTFATRHSIRPWIEEFPMNSEGLTRALDSLKRGEIRYRAVLSTELSPWGEL